MADAKGKEAPPSGDSGFGPALVVLALLLALWFMQGAKRTQLTGQIIQSPLATTSAPHRWLPCAGGVPGTSIEPSSGSSAVDAGAVSGAGEQSSTAGPGVSILDYSGARASDPQQEYIVLYANQANAAPVSISGWQLRSARTGRTVPIGGGVETALTGQPASPSVITLAPGQSAVISTGRSPVGISFRENKCTGYLAQFQSFAPALTQRCPSPQAELQTHTDLVNDRQCLFAAGSIAPCRAVVQPPSAVSDACSMFLQQNFTYNGCVNAHRNDPDFGGGQWRIYLGQTTEFWNNAGDKIDVLNMQGKVVSSVMY